MDVKPFVSVMLMSVLTLPIEAQASAAEDPVVTSARQSSVPTNAEARSIQRDYAAEQSEFSKNLAAARRGDASSYIKLAGHYMGGRGVARDYSKALFWLRKAEGQKDPAAFLELSWVYFNGFGVPQDFQKSYDYARLSRNAGGSNDGVTFLMRLIMRRIGANAFKCLEYGFVYQTPQFAQCHLQLDQAQKQASLFNQHAEIARQQYELERARYAQQLEEARLAKELAEKEQEARERRARSERLFQLSEDMLCPKEGPGGIFAEPVAGCGRNKNKPQAPTVNVFVQPEKKYCGATAAGPIRC